MTSSARQHRNPGAGKCVLHSPEPLAPLTQCASHTIFNVFATGKNGVIETETECATLDEALCHLRELVLNELADPGGDGPNFDRYGLRFDRLE